MVADLVKSFAIGIPRKDCSPKTGRHCAFVSQFLRGDLCVGRKILTFWAARFATMAASSGDCLAATDATKRAPQSQNINMITTAAACNLSRRFVEWGNMDHLRKLCRQPSLDQVRNDDDDDDDSHPQW